VRGPCEGDYREWHHDPATGTCREVSYGGCLGNGNRFPSEAACQETCRPRPEQPLCRKPKAEGGCREELPRWYYDRVTGRCRQFSYSGCGGNNNRFLEEAECEASCRHEARALQTLRTCELFPEPGDCAVEGARNRTLARWTFHPYSKRCIPFYYSGCGGNRNNFLSQAACQEVCPTTFRPVLTLPETPVLLQEGRAGTISVVIQGNPPPRVTWLREGRRLGEGEGGQYRVGEDHSLRIGRVEQGHSGHITVEADNGVGSPASLDILVVVWPTPITLLLEGGEEVVRPEEDVELQCSATGFPRPTIVWWREHFLRRARRIKEGRGVVITTRWAAPL
jgi:hypothetical protein